MPLSFVPTTHLEAYFCCRIDFPGSGGDLSQLIMKMRAWRHQLWVFFADVLPDGSLEGLYLVQIR